MKYLGWSLVMFLSVAVFGESGGNQPGNPGQPALGKFQVADVRSILVSEGGYTVKALGMDRQLYQIAFKGDLCKGIVKEQLENASKNRLVINYVFQISPPLQPQKSSELLPPRLWQGISCELSKYDLVIDR